MSSTKACFHGAGVLAVALLGSGCVVQTDDAGPFREAVPDADAVALAGPETEPGSVSTQQAPRTSLASDETWASGPWAKWYGFTREVRDGVNHLTRDVLGAVWYIVHTEPSSVSAGEAIWGPYTDALEPVTWRFRVRRVGPEEMDHVPAEYQYILEGRPKASTSDADFRPVLTGHGWGRDSEQHGDGQFVINLDVARELDPFKHRSDSGTVTVLHDLSRDFTSNAFALPRTVMAEIRPSVSSEWVAITTRANEDGTGALLVNAFVDIDETHTTASEDVEILSRWSQSGAGRADISLSGGDVPDSLGVVNATECWGADFYQVYYADNVNFAPTEGDASACVYAQPLEPGLLELVEPAQ